MRRGREKFLWTGPDRKSDFLKWHSLQGISYYTVVTFSLQKSVNVREILLFLEPFHFFALLRAFWQTVVICYYSNFCGYLSI